VKRVILIDPAEESREVLVRRLHAQGYHVEATSNAAAGADLALNSPPSAVIADLWMPSISGVQLCRLLRAEPATLEVPLILRGAEDDPKSRFWADRAGAAAYVRKGHMGELVRALARTALATPPVDDFFIQESSTAVDIRDRIARHLDSALFESVIASEVRALSASGSIDRLFDLFSQLVSQLVRYRWLALATDSPACFGLHHHPASASTAEAEARNVLKSANALHVLRVEDEDADAAPEGPAPLVFEVPFAGIIVGHVAIAPLHTSTHDADNMLRLVSRELGGPLRMAALVDEQQRLAAVDPLTNLSNRRSFLATIRAEIIRSARWPISLLMLDVDHFKAINDRRGHAGGDQVLVDLAALLRKAVLPPHLVARWGGEEFVIAYLNTNSEQTVIAAQELRRAIADLVVNFEGSPIPVTASLGCATLDVQESVEQLLDRADRAMYRAKAGGRNRVVADEDEPEAVVSLRLATH